MARELFPTTTVGGVELTRLIAGTNWIFGWSHKSPACDNMIKEKFSEENKKNIIDMYVAFLNNGINVTMAPFHACNFVVECVLEAQERTGRKMHIIDTPILDMADTAEGRRNAESIIKRAGEYATFCFLHHSSVEQLLNRHTETMDRLPDYLSMIRDHGMHPGLSAHMPEVLLYADQNNYDVETYIQIYNCLGFLMQVEIENVNKIIWNAKKPVMTIKSMAAGRTTPFVGLNFSFATLRPCDMVTIGCFTPEQVDECVEIAHAALEHRPPDVEGRNSPNKNTNVLSV